MTFAKSLLSLAVLLWIPTGLLPSPLASPTSAATSPPAQTHHPLETSNPTGMAAWGFWFFLQHCFMFSHKTPWNAQTLFCSPGSQADISLVCVALASSEGQRSTLVLKFRCIYLKYKLWMAGFSLSFQNFCLFLCHVRNRKSGYKIAHVQQCSITRHWAL